MPEIENPEGRAMPEAYTYDQKIEELRGLLQIAQEDIRQLTLRIDALSDTPARAAEAATPKKEMRATEG